MIAILGGGLAGLTTAHKAAVEGAEPIAVVEKEGFLGGASRTVQVGPYRFDLGGHRFYTKKPHVQQYVESLLGDQVISVDRLSRICLNGKMVNYPLSGFNAFAALGLVKSARVLMHYMLTKAAPPVDDGTFEHWVLKRFGRGLYEIYFKGYTEKVWGIPCNQLSADFAEQRIKGLSLRSVVKQYLLRTKASPSSLIKRFTYSRLGFGQIPDAMARALVPPHQVFLNSDVECVHHDGQKIHSVTVRTNGFSETLDTSQVVSTIPLEVLLERMRPEPPAPVVAAARQLRYRDLVVIFLGLNRPQVTPDHWIYFPDRDICFGRVHEPPNWSRAMAPPGKTSLVVEWFATKGDPPWTLPDEEIYQRVVNDLVKLRLIAADEVDLHKVIRVERAYPLYRMGYLEHRNTVQEYLGRFSNLHLSGRNGTFLYTSSDHYIDMGLKIAENLLGASHDISRIGQEKGYAEA